MATEAGERIDAAEVWRAIGRLESDTSTLKDGQSEIKADLEKGQSELKAGFERGQSELKADFERGQSELKAGFERGQSELKADFERGQSELKADFERGQSELREDMRELNRRMDRMFYSILAVGGALFVAIFASNFIGN